MQSELSKMGAESGDLKWADSVVLCILNWN